MAIKTSKTKKLDCEAKLQVACNNQGVRTVRGPKRGDPQFACCLGCRAYLRRQGVKVKDINDDNGMDRADEAACITSAPG